MWNAFRGALAVLTRKSELLVWALIFPIILTTLFMFMFANLDESTAFEPVSTAVVADDAYRADEAFSAMVDELAATGDDQLLDVHEFASADEARAALDAGEVVGVLSVDGEGVPQLAVSPATDNMGAKQIGRTILNTVADTYVRNAELLEGIAHDNPMALADPDLVERALTSGDATAEVSLTHNTPSQSVRFYYALLGMACLFCAQIGLLSICEAQPNLSALGARRAVGAVSRGKTLAATLMASWVLAMACLLVALLYMRFTAGIDFAGREVACIGAIAVCALFATALGTFLGSLPKVGLGVKTGLLTGLTCLLSLFAGLYGEPVMQMADQLARDFPLLASLNPAKVVTDTFYSLYYYDSLGPFIDKIGLLLVMTAVVFAVSVLFIRRQRYASL
ncbi:ABC transporter permease [Arabiibacter massiliensis]|uniref:ABC transporter permease n=1 Tax=Arabiibacter massiliensis TaxID=1870985 RepID=UPI0009BC5A3B|nr:ABC transporter permease [Arabiibacter massiliensis]